MNYITINKNLSGGILNIPGMFPHFAKLRSSKYIFKINFGLKELPKKPGILIIRGARQYGINGW